MIQVSSKIESLIKKSSKFKKLGINNARDLAYYFPIRHEKRTPKKADELTDGEYAVVSGIVENNKKFHPKPKLHIVQIVIRTGEGQYLKASFFNDPKASQLKKGFKLSIYGKIKISSYGIEVAVKDWEEINEDEDYAEKHAGFIPIYPLVYGVGQDFVYAKVKNLLNHIYIPEYMPRNILDEYNLIDVNQSIKEYHFPTNEESLEKAKERLAFDELFFMQLGLRLKTDRKRHSPKDLRYNSSPRVPAEFIKSLPFSLTKDQLKVWKDINADMASPFPMRRLLMGDVGSGKTIIAELALLKAAESGIRGVFMVPTEVLALQHYSKLVKTFENFGYKVGLSTSSSSVNLNEWDVLIGTHSLIHEGADLEGTGLVVIDEQHRFGVDQRNRLQEKAGNPDVLVMTATPIPRTMALTFYGDMDLSVIKELPGERKKVITYLTRKKEKVYDFLAAELRKNRQGYVVCPLVEESESLDLENAEFIKEEISERIPEANVGLVHGHMRPQDKNSVMESFRKAKYNLLVSTTVIEVGVDVPNATVMVIIDADRFGLAQLHQMRGRVGRGEHQSYCIALAPNARSKKSVNRLKAFASTSDGFKLAEYDLKLRGAGEFFGKKQAGMVDVKVADLNDTNMIEKAREAADKIRLTQSLLDELKIRYNISHVRGENNVSGI